MIEWVELNEVKPQDRDLCIMHEIGAKEKARWHQSEAVESIGIYRMGYFSKGDESNPDEYTFWEIPDSAWDRTDSPEYKEIKLVTENKYFWANLHAPLNAAAGGGPMIDWQEFSDGAPWNGYLCIVQELTQKQMEIRCNAKVDFPIGLYRIGCFWETFYGSVSKHVFTEKAQWDYDEECYFPEDEDMYPGEMTYFWAYLHEPDL